MSPRIRLPGPRRLSLWLLLAVQLLLILSYFYLKVDREAEDENSSFASDIGKISFLSAGSDDSKSDKTYHTWKSKIFLKNVNIRDSYRDFNSSLCYVNGTDLGMMKRSIWECSCLPGWHGKDCAQPEVIWRAFLTYKKPIKLKGPRTFERRIIYIFSVDKFTETITGIRVNELGDTVDLFVLYENETSHHILHKLNDGFLKKYHDKIMYIKENNIDNLWKVIRKSVRNLRNDDVILTSHNNEIPNKYVMNFLKFYEKWPEPVRFRLRWSVYGFFWVHPERTIITGGASTVGYLKEVFNGRLHYLSDNKTLSNPAYKGIILGDLNHFGGWFCDFCQDPGLIVEYLSKPNTIDLEKIGKPKIDVDYVENVIENGLYIDGKLELNKARRYKEKYFAPYHVLENDWKYDTLLINFYSKLDYYEG